MPSLFFGGGMSKQSEWVIGIIILLVIIAIAYHYYMPKSCKADTDCKTGQKCTSGKCGFHASKAGRKGRFSSDEMNWPTADSLVPGDTFPFGNYSGYGVNNTSMSYDPLY
jgi:hypothetical protein